MKLEKVLKSESIQLMIPTNIYTKMIYNQIINS